MAKLRHCSLPLLPVLLAAQSPASVRQAVNFITPAAVIRRIGILADDSMLGRATPSPQLEQVARYVADEFRRFGLRPGGDSGTFIQHYPIVRRQLDTARSALTVGGLTLKVGRQVNVVRYGLPSAGGISGPVVLLAGPADSANPFRGASVRGAWVALIVTAGAGQISLNGALGWRAIRAGALGVLVVSNRSDDQWQDQVGRVVTPSYALGRGQREDGPWFLEIRDATASRALGVDAAALRSHAAPSPPAVARRLPGITLTARLQYEPGDLRAPNVIGILEGRDPRLKRQYVFFTGHMDHLGTPGSGEGCVARGADSICNGADDDASGTTAVIEAAEAFARLSPRPKRSLVFMTVSGEERGLWGSSYYTDHPTVPLADVVADLNTDMVGRNWRDTIAVIGKEHSDLGATLNRVAAAHPELRMHAIDDIWPTESFYFRSDHYNFARKGVPILFFFNGVHADYHQVSDEVAKIDAEKESRIVQLVFYLGLEIANAAERPQWNPDSYRRIVEGGGRGATGPDR